MSSDELQELHEHAEHARHDPSAAPVSLTMAVLAVVVATVSLMGHRAHTEEVMLQNKTTDQWAYYQAKNIRKHMDEMFVDLSAAGAFKPGDPMAKLQTKYDTEAKRYGDDQKAVEAEAKNLETETEEASRHADRYDLGEVFLEVALVVTSITLLSGRRAFWFAGIVFGIVGTAVAAGILGHLIK
jgi:hypothetical protein